MNYDNPFNKSVTGQEVKDWVWYHSHNKTKYTALAKRMISCFNLNDEKYYMLALCDGMPIIKEVPEKGKVYEIPCDG